MTGIDLQMYDKDEEEVDFQYGEKSDNEVHSHSQGGCYTDWILGGLLLT